jgi:Rod binding domain-containing protein
MTSLALQPGITEMIGGQSFERLPASARARGASAADAEQAAFDRQLDEAATQFVAISFIQPILQQMRQSSIAEEPFAPGAGERRFAPLLDQHLADRIVGSSNFPIVDVVKRHLAGDAYAAAGEMKAYA